MSHKLLLLGLAMALPVARSVSAMSVSQNQVVTDAIGLNQSESDQARSNQAQSDQMTSDHASILAAVLREHYPEVTRWHIEPLSDSRHMGFQSKRRMQRLHSTLPIAAEWVIAHDGEIFSVHSAQQRPQRFRVLGWRSMWVTQQDANKGSALHELQIALDERNVFGLRCEPLSSTAALTVIRMRRALRKYEPVCAQDVEHRPLIDKHQAITVICARGTVVVSTTAQALSVGEIGQWIRVKRQASREVLRAKVSKEGEANACV